MSSAGQVQKVGLSIRQFVNRNRKEIDQVIRAECPNIGRLDNDEREAWISNHEGLYNWARGCGVDV